jgi:glycerol-3-phosphate acyltransferase PlsX
VKIAVDAMGGDHAPEEIVKGAIEAARDYGIPTVLVGIKEQIEQELAKNSYSGSLLEVYHASEVVQMDEHPATAMRRKPDSSLVVAANMVKRGEAQAMVSAGNTGATMAVATLKLGRIKGIDRPAISSFLPTKCGQAVIVDAGACVDCSAENLLQFGIMGSQYVERVLRVERPKVGLLSIGEEPTKGNELTKSANEALSREPGLNFIGNVEGKEIFQGMVDVVVCDGFDGNIVLKISEGIGEFLLSSIKDEISGSLWAKIGAWFMMPALKRFNVKLDYAEYGGAPLLGIDGVCIIGHGRSNAKAARNAIRAAAEAVKNDVVGCITEAVHMHRAAV